MNTIEPPWKVKFLKLKSNIIPHQTVCNNSEVLEFISYTVCATRYRTQHFFNNFTTNEDILTTTDTNYRHTLQTHTTDTNYRHTLQTHTTDTHYRHIPLHFSHNELTPAKISLQYLH